MGTRKKVRHGPRAPWGILAFLVVGAVLASLLVGRRTVPLDAPRPVGRGQLQARAPAAPVPATVDGPDPARPPEPTRGTAPADSDGHGRVAIVIDDLGDSLDAGRIALALEPPATMAVIPFRAASARIAAAAVEHGREVILHLPLEPERTTEMARASGFLRTSMSADGIERQLDADLAAVPYIIGVNGHMGSRFTRDRTAMERLLVALRARGLFFLDSLTTPASVAAATAARIGVPFVQRSIFLDHDPAPAAVAAALARVTRLVRGGRDVVAIGHPHAATLAALEPWMADAASAGIRVVPLSALVR